MKYSILPALFTIFVLANFQTVYAQDDEVRQATGLPIVIGENVARGPRMNISGRITLEMSEKPARLPIITVRVLYAGATADRAIANDQGFYLIRNVPRDNITVIVEIDGTEVLRQPVIAAPMGNHRFDHSIQWLRGGPTESAPAVISAAEQYKRSERNEANFRRALAADKANDATRAIEYLNMVLEADPKDYAAWTELGTVFFKIGSLDNAEACYFKAIELKRDYYVGLLNLGKLYLSRDRVDNAVLVLSNAVKRRPASPDAHELLGEAYIKAKKGTAAVHHFNEALRLSPNDKAEVHLRLARLYDAAGLKQKASAQYEAFLKKRPDHPDKKNLQKYISENPS
ncbi:MAG TPA: tetratricopeptide repeat protein [Pyrinomonadaceae bacterium]|nr:tetratricopeptide repeat protein [Pyrinomonadaceae bacterium]